MCMQGMLQTTYKHSIFLAGAIERYWCCCFLFICLLFSIISFPPFAPLLTCYMSVFAYDKPILFFDKGPRVNQESLKRLFKFLRAHVWAVGRHLVDHEGKARVYKFICEVSSEACGRFIPTYRSSQFDREIIRNVNMEESAWFPVLRNSERSEVRNRSALEHVTRTKIPTPVGSQRTKDAPRVQDWMFGTSFQFTRTRVETATEGESGIDSNRTPNTMLRGISMCWRREILPHRITEKRFVYTTCVSMVLG